GFLLGEGKQHFDHHTVHDHRAGKTRSNLDFKVVLKDRSRSAYTGLIRIEPGCPDSEAYQENRNLLLNDGARAESIPELEILTDEVKCTHGATMGTLDAQHLFYLMSRGIDRAEAIRLIVGGFIEPTLSRLDEDLSARLRRHVEESVKDLGSPRGAA
ncbi:MAG TPA: SufD family Fe-S cluster assembly protein, partial [Planctomycetota bacterium]|nr:SufD family Fe-S cluster assembly protein [Planctomycetota bacterium]